MIHTEGLHALEVGTMDYSLKILLDLLSSKHESMLDGLVKRLVNQPQQHGYGPFPCLLWPNGVTTISNLTGDLKVGKFMGVIAVSLTLEGQQFFESVLPDGIEGWQKMTYVFQQIICYWAWLPRDDGEGLDLIKVHEQYHVPEDLERHGCHKNVHSAPQEHNHILIKRAAQKTQKNKKPWIYKPANV
jgi:hypothetical protein